MAISIVDLYGKVLPPNEWIIEGLLTRRNTGFLMGPPKKSGKSWLLLNAAWDLSEGKPVWGVPSLVTPKAQRVVYFTQEDSEANIQDRIKNVVKGGRKLNDRVWVIPKNLNLKLDTVEGMKLIARELDQVAKASGEIDLVMFDPMRRIHDGEENDSGTIAKLWHQIDLIHAHFNCATLIAHHIVKPPLNKEGYDPADPYQGRGSGDIYGGGDAFMMVVPKTVSPSGARNVSVHFESKRGAQLNPVELRIGFGEGRVDFLG